jgi:hypothetical protein
LPNLHLDRGYGSAKTRDLLDLLGFTPHIAVKGQPAPIRAGHRWPVQRTHSWLNGYGKLRRCTDKRINPPCASRDSATGSSCSVTSSPFTR